MIADRRPLDRDCPDIETQFAPDNYMGTHSLLFTVDVYTETGIMATVMLDKQWTVQAAIHAGADMAPWYAGATPTGMFGVRWVSEDNNDSFYTVLNAINNAKFRYFDLDGAAGRAPQLQHLQSHLAAPVQPTSSSPRPKAYIMWEQRRRGRRHAEHRPVPVRQRRRDRPDRPGHCR